MQNLTRTLVMLPTLGLLLVVPGASALGPSSLDAGASLDAHVKLEFPDAEAMAKEQVVYAEARADEIRADVEAKVDATISYTQTTAEETQEQTQARASAEASASGQAAAGGLAKIGDAFYGLASFVGSIFVSISATLGAK